MAIEQNDQFTVYVEIPERKSRPMTVPIVPKIGDRIQLHKDLAVDNVDCTLEVTKHEWRLRPTYNDDSPEQSGVELSLWISTKVV